MDHTITHWNLQLCGLLQQISLDMNIWKSYSILLFARLLVFTWPVDLIRKTSGAFSVLFGLMNSFLFSLENLQVVVNGAWGEEWGYWSKAKMPWLFLYSRFAWQSVRSSLKRELCKYYIEISSLQSTLLSPVQFKIGPDVFILMSNVKRTWSFFGWKNLNSYTAFVWASAFSQMKSFAEWLSRRNPQMLLKVHLLHYVNTLWGFFCTVANVVFRNNDWMHPWFLKVKINDER